MAYESYTQVTWTPATPITADRLQQMSVNTEQVKEATNDNPRGLIKIKTITTAAAAPGGALNWNNFDTYNEVINLKNEGSGNPNYAITLPGSRYARISLQFPGFFFSSGGAEDATYYIRLTQKSLSGAPEELCVWKLSPAIYTYINNASGAASASNTALKSDGYYFGAGTYSHVLQSGGGFKEADGTGIFNIQVYREVGASSANPTTWSIPVATERPLQFYLEDIGGTA